MTTTLIDAPDEFEVCENCDGTGQLRMIDQGTEIYYPCYKCGGKGKKRRVRENV